MINIYCLIDPRNNHPFYVGATKIRIKTRLSQHIHDALHRRDALNWPDELLERYHPRIGRLKLINTLLDAGAKPSVLLLMKTDFHGADYYEKFFFELLKGQGYRIFQETKRFKYQSTTITKRQNNRPLTKLLQNTFQ